MTTAVGKWNPFYADLRGREPYGDVAAYIAGANWLAGCVTVEDWGCGKGWFKHYAEHGYRGIDGSASPFADVVADLATYVPARTPAGIFMRGVLEHNDEWQPILRNALTSFKERMALGIYTPSAEVTGRIDFDADYDVPVIAFADADIRAAITAAGARLVDVDYVQTPRSAYPQERLFLIERA